MNEINIIETTEDIDAMLQASQDSPIVLLKHSSTCPISTAGHNQFMKLNDEAETVPPMYLLVVQEARAASQEIAERLEVTHQSPQVIIIDKGEAKVDMSHYKIKTDAVLAAYSELAAS